MIQPTQFMHATAEGSGFKGPRTCDFRAARTAGIGDSHIAFPITTPSTGQTFPKNMSAILNVRSPNCELLPYDMTDIPI